MARISTHVLDTARGRPAEGVQVELRSRGSLIVTAKTNADGRTSEPLLVATELAVGSYELMFRAGPYLRGAHAGLAEPLFLDDISIKFQVSEPEGNYHVPLLLSPFAYSTYRGS